MIGTVVGVGAVLLAAGTIAATARVIRRGRSAWRRVIAVVICLLVLLSALLPIDSLVGDVRQQLRPSAPELTFLAGARTERTFVIFPTIILPAAQMYAQQIPLFRQYGNVVLVDYPRGEHDRDALGHTVTEFLVEHRLAAPYVVGTSFGVVAGVDFVRSYRDRGRPSGPVEGFMAISGPADGSDVRSPLPIDLSLAVNGGPLAQWLYPKLYDRGVALQDVLRPLPAAQRGLEQTVPRGAVVQAYQGMKTYDLRSLLARLQVLSRTSAPAADEFAGIPATILWVNHPAGDYMIKNQAIGKLRQAFPDASVVAELPGAHANLIRWGPTYTDIIKQRLDEQFLESPVV